MKPSLSSPAISLLHSRSGKHSGRTCLAKRLGQTFLLGLALLLACLVIHARSAPPAAPLRPTTTMSASSHYFRSGRWHADALSLAYLFKYLASSDSLPQTKPSVLG